ncbi:transcription factor [Recurvomyces mirabilis]|nr:transcription factor [Recurvomyces mirabilis]
MNIKRNSFDFVLEDPGVHVIPPQQSSGDERLYRPRRPHTKSRNGCLEYRRRRMKCGEERPICLQCSERHFTCRYRDRDPSPSRRDSRTNTTPDNDSTRFSGSVTFELQEQCVPYGAAAFLPAALFADPVYCQDDVHIILDHFTQPTDPPWIGSRTLQHIMQTHGVHVASSTPYLMHTILAFSAAHLNHLHPTNARWRFAAIAHYDYALSLWQQRLARIPSPERYLAARLCAIFLHAMLAILHSTTELGDGLEHEEWKAGSTCVPSVLGIHGLLHGPGVDLTELDQEIWGPLLRRYVAPPRGPGGLEDSTTGIQADSPERAVLASLEQICISSDPAKISLYRSAVSLWHGLIDSSPRSNDDSEMIDVCFSAASQLMLEFANLLKSKDSRAILLVEFWLIMLEKRCSWWWVAASTRRKGPQAIDFLRAQREYEEDGRFTGVVAWMEEWVWRHERS